MIKNMHGLVSNSPATTGKSPNKQKIEPQSSERIIKMKWASGSHYRAPEPIPCFDVPGSEREPSAAGFQSARPERPPPLTRQRRRCSFRCRLMAP